MKANSDWAGLFLLVTTVAAFAGEVGAATIEVADGVVEIAQDGQCSLIEALENANGGTIHADCTAGEDGLDTVALAAGSTYILTEVHNVDDDGEDPDGANGLPSVSTPIVVQGRDATIERSSEGDTPDFRLLYVDNMGDLALEELTLRNGRSLEGGGIANVGTLTVNAAVLSGNSVTGSGGAIYSVEGDVTISYSMLSNNSAVSGGGLKTSFFSSTIILNSAITDNSGSGVSCLDGNLTIVNTTVSGSSGIGVAAEGCPLNLLNSTLSGNLRGLWTQKQSTILTNTIVANSLEADCSQNKTTLNLHGVNLIEDGTCGCAGPFCITGGPQLGELADNGGPTPTHALLVGSIAIDKADDAECPKTDQRGVPRGVDGPGDGSGEDLDGGCDIGAFEADAEGFVPKALIVDPEAVISDGNDALEPGERVVVAPAWQNGFSTAEFRTGKAADFAGPLGPVYDLVADDAVYGDVEPGAIASCQDTGVCYQMEVGPVNADRPATHWDTTFEETLSDENVKTWALHVGESFPDIPRTSPLYQFVETILHRGVVTGSCNEITGEFCPTDPVSRILMALLTLRAVTGPGYMPPACIEGQETFVDVPFWLPLCPWVEELASRGVVAGCGGGNYCPSSSVTRAQMAVFLLRTLEGGSYMPPACTGRFADVPCPSIFANWVEEAYKRDITSGCGTDPLRYCPNSLLTRGQMSVFLSKTFDLKLYGP